MFFWQYLRSTKKPMTLKERGFAPSVSACAPYPAKSDEISLHPLGDAGNNYERPPRYHPIMDGFCDEALRTEVLGIPADDWRMFLELHSESASAEEIRSKTLSAFRYEGLSGMEKVIGMMNEIIDELSEK